jgi:hypothetical protein
LRDSYAATIMPLPRYRIPILTVAGLIEIAALQPAHGAGRPDDLKQVSGIGGCFWDNLLGHAHSPLATSRHCRSIIERRRRAGDRNSRTSCRYQPGDADPHPFSDYFTRAETHDPLLHCARRGCF